MSYDFPTEKVYRPNEEAVQARKRVRGVDGNPTTVTLEAVSATFRADVSRVNLASAWQNHDYYRRPEGGRREDKRAGASGDVDLNALFEKDLL